MILLENTILQYEKDFFDAEFCRIKDNIENRIGLDFCEYGKSGTIHKRSDVVNSLANMQNNRDIEIYNFSAITLNKNIVIAHYFSHDKITNQYALRASIWKQEDTLWKIFFHQGTSCSCPK